jgi:cell division transport system ATP-binding protein
MIRFDQVTKQFSDDSYALRDVSFTINPGEFVLLTGPSGSGKTTIMRLLTREYIPSEGEITFEEIPLSEIGRSRIHLHRRKIGVVFQDYKLLTELNVWENIALALNIIGKNQDEVEARVTDLLRLVNLTEKAFLFPSQLSGGEAQRVSIARALATGPNVIFADEPTGNLDPETSLSIARLLKKINELGTTVLFATHDVSVLQALPNERNLHLNQGALVGDATGSTHARSSKTYTVTKAESPKKSETDAGTKHSTKQTADTPQPATNTKPEAEPQEMTVAVENLSDKPSKKFGISLGWPFGKKKPRDQVISGSDKNEDLNRLNGDPPEVSVESLDSDTKKSSK